MTEEMRIRCPRCGAANPEKRVDCEQCQWLLSTPYPQRDGLRRDPGRSARQSFPARRDRRVGPRIWLAPAILGAGLLLCSPIAFLGGYTLGWATQKPSGPPQVEWKTRTAWKTRTVVKWRTRTVTTTQPAPSPATIPGSLTWSGDTWPIRIPVEMANPATGQTFPTYAEIDTGASYIYSTPQAAKTLRLPVLYRGTQANMAGVQPTTVYGPLEVETRSGQPILRVAQDYAQLTDSWYIITGNELDLGQAFWGLPDVHLSIHGGAWTVTVDPAS